MKEYRFNDLRSMVWAIEEYVEDLVEEYEQEYSDLEHEHALLEDDVAELIAENNRLRDELDE